MVAIAAAFVGQGVPGSAGAEPVAVGSSIRVFGGDPSTSVWSGGRPTRFETRGLGVPPSTCISTRTRQAATATSARSSVGRVDVCVVSVFELGRETLLHEMGHAWIDQNVAQTVRERFTEMRGLRAWNQSTVPWDDRAYEHGAEIIAWGLGNRYMAPSIPDRDPAGLAAGFEFLTGVPFPNPMNV